MLLDGCGGCMDGLTKFARSSGGRRTDDGRPDRQMDLGAEGDTLGEISRDAGRAGWRTWVDCLRHVEGQILSAGMWLATETASAPGLVPHREGPV